MEHIVIEIWNFIKEWWPLSLLALPFLGFFLPIAAHMIDDRRTGVV